MEKNNPLTHRVVTFLTREELEFLDKLEKDAIFSTGKHISRSKIIEDLTDILAKTRMDAVGINNNEELEQRIINAIVKMCQEQLRKQS